jgi:glycine cleavage system regulatory protein
MAGSLMFHATALLRVPDGVALEELRATLEGIGDDLMVDVCLVPIDERRAMRD